MHSESRYGSDYFAISCLANRRGGTREILWVCGTVGVVADRCKFRVMVGDGLTIIAS